MKGLLGVELGMCVQLLGGIELGMCGRRQLLGIELGRSEQLLGIELGVGSCWALNSGVGVVTANFQGLH